MLPHCPSVYMKVHYVDHSIIPDQKRLYFALNFLPLPRHKQKPHFRNADHRIRKDNLWGLKGHQVQPSLHCASKAGQEHMQVSETEGGTGDIPLPAKDFYRFPFSRVAACYSFVLGDSQGSNTQCSLLKDASHYAQQLYHRPVLRLGSLGSGLWSKASDSRLDSNPSGLPASELRFKRQIASDVGWLPGTRRWGLSKWASSFIRQFTGAETHGAA